MNKNMDQLIIRGPKDLKEWIKAEAEKEDRSMNYVAVKMLEEAKQHRESNNA